MHTVKLRETAKGFARRRQQVCGSNAAVVGKEYDKTTIPCLHKQHISKSFASIAYIFDSGCVSLLRFLYSATYSAPTNFSLRWGLAFSPLSMSVSSGDSSQEPLADQPPLLLAAFRVPSVFFSLLKEKGLREVHNPSIKDQKD